jgi:hypothetical protein
MFQTKIVEKRETHVLCSVFFPLENCAAYAIMWENVVERGRPQMTICRMRIACWIPEATNTHTGCVKLIAFPLQQWLYERASMLRYTLYCLSCFVLLRIKNKCEELKGHFCSRKKSYSRL